MLQASSRKWIKRKFTWSIL